jgi:hypothetical protein
MFHRKLSKEMCNLYRVVILSDFEKLGKMYQKLTVKIYSGKYIKRKVFGKTPTKSPSNQPKFKTISILNAKRME